MVLCPVIGPFNLPPPSFPHWLSDHFFTLTLIFQHNDLQFFFLAILSFLHLLLFLSRNASVFFSRCPLPSLTGLSALSLWHSVPYHLWLGLSDTTPPLLFHKTLAHPSYDLSCDGVFVYVVLTRLEASWGQKLELTCLHIPTLACHIYL